MGNQKRLEKKNFLKGKPTSVRGSKYKKNEKVSKGCISAEGMITKANGAGLFIVTLDNSIEVQAVLSGSLRQHNIRILVGDKVKLELSVYDLTKGRITRRLK